jgi:uncharacterized membrane protein YeaQ/YmgE (transglycosylase-associated protein family)
MDPVWLILIGALVGFLGRLVAGRDVSLLLTILIGIVGVWGGFYIWHDVMNNDSEIMGCVVGVFVAALIIVLVGRFSKGHSHSR